MNFPSDRFNFSLNKITNYNQEGKLGGETGVESFLKRILNLKLKALLSRAFGRSLTTTPKHFDWVDGEMLSYDYFSSFPPFVGN